MRYNHRALHQPPVLGPGLHRRRGPRPVEARARCGSAHAVAQAGTLAQPTRTEPQSASSAATLGLKREPSPPHAIHCPGLQLYAFPSMLSHTRSMFLVYNL